MTDKQIIIDGVDVSGCCQYMPRYMEDYDIDTLDYCGYHFKPCKDVDVKYCYYKQLKAQEQELQTAIDNYVKLDNQRVKEYNELVDKYNLKEQECERLKEEMGTRCESCKALHIIADDYNDCITENKQLKAEKERLQEEREKAKNYNYEYGQLLIKSTNENNKLKRILTEIKEIAEKQMAICSCTFDLNNYESGCRECSSKDARVIAKHILQKISECEVEDGNI